MPTIAHPDGDGRIEVEVIDSESHRGNDMVQVEAIEDGVDLSDPSGNNPWVFEEDVSGL